MKSTTGMFALPARILHWLMAILILAMLFIGIGMAASVSARHEWLLRIHKPLGIAILILVVVRITVRLRNPPPPLPADLPFLQKLAAHASHWLLYGLIIAMPLVGWAMLSAGGYPVMLSDSLRLPPLFPTSSVAFAVLRHLHTWLALLLFATFLAHMAAALYHGLIRRDGVLSSMTYRSPEADVLALPVETATEMQSCAPGSTEDEAGRPRAAAIRFPQETLRIDESAAP